MKRFIISIYCVLALITAIYQAVWGTQAWRGLAYAIGQGLVWPAVWFPSLGSIIGGLIWIIIIVFLLILGLFMRKS
ncbi:MULTISPECIES: hypothetical protein [Enterobacterales]|uniref:hypothetical protein n=1 Tax=Enterobacterales TaxID=91347 RepID=UPI000750CF2A|nr:MULTISPECIES: hypothetical protein [Enterobacteriaceae]EIV2091292.1 hypothetical protein [Klebsiella pneumoniae subsp. ozaenae]NHJ97685.1 hypothetical protein [Klebsiella quasipneumoniae subsp. similipneumoniae]AWD00887.1 hypothetical protein AM388_26405 [Klebsiella pneumoniae]AWD98603.1 hypothetical protein AM389_26705 [Klebsiella pneumoniae]AWS85780.1 hypothetical protein AM387_20400 [Klebsiella pneumoniae]